MRVGRADRSCGLAGLMCTISAHPEPVERRTLRQRACRLSASHAGPAHTCHSEERSDEESRITRTTGYAAPRDRSQPRPRFLRGHGDGTARTWCPLRMTAVGLPPRQAEAPPTPVILRSETTKNLESPAPPRYAAPRDRSQPRPRFLRGHRDGTARTWCPLRMTAFGLPPGGPRPRPHLSFRGGKRRRISNHPHHRIRLAARPVAAPPQIPSRPWRWHRADLVSAQNDSVWPTPAAGRGRAGR